MPACRSVRNWARPARPLSSLTAARPLPGESAHGAALNGLGWWKADVAASVSCRHHTRMMRWLTLLIFAVPLALLGCSRSPETYSAACATPPPNWGTEKNGIGHLLPVMSVLLATDGTVLWNRIAISEKKLQSYMNEASNLNPVPQIVLEVSPAAQCQKVHEVRSIMDQAPMCKEPHSRCSEGWRPKEWPMYGGP